MRFGVSEAEEVWRIAVPGIVVRDLTVGYFRKLPHEEGS